MKFDWISITIALFAVFGLYFLFSKLLGGLFGRRFVMAIRACDYEDEYDMLCAWHGAQLKASVTQEADGIPVVLIDSTVSLHMYNLLREEGIPVYRKVE